MTATATATVADSDSAPAQRLFIGLRVPGPPAMHLGAMAGYMHQALGSRRDWHPEEAGYHITLRFLGDTPADAVPDVREAMRAAVAGRPPFTLTAGDKIGVFDPGPSRPAIYWGGVGGDAARLDETRRRLNEALARRLGLPAEPLPDGDEFTPHITLGRVRNPDPELRKRVAELWAEAPRYGNGTKPAAAHPWTVDCLILYRSTLTRGRRVSLTDEDRKRPKPPPSVIYAEQFRAHFDAGQLEEATP